MKPGLRRTAQAVRHPRRSVRQVKAGRARRQLDSAVARWASQHPDVVFVQIGSHNGLANDPIARHIDAQPGWRGTMVEPVPRLFEQLQRRRGNENRFRLVQAAVATEPGTVTMTTVDSMEGLPAWADQLTSLRPEVVLKHRHAIPDLEERLTTIEVPAVTFEQLVGDISSIDLLHTDTEGFDAAILDQVDLARWQPSLVLFEHAHLDDADWSRCKERLLAAGYELRWSETDTLGLLRRP